MERARLCDRPGCADPATAMLVFQYATRTLWVDDLGPAEPSAIDLCARHADRLRPPVGWSGEDRRRPAPSAPARVAS